MASDKHPCQRCGSEEWTYVDYGGCSECRPYEERDSEDAILQEIYANEPWKLLVCCILLNQTGRTQVDRVLGEGELFKKFPNASAMSTARHGVLYNEISQLGLGERRARTLVNMSKRWVELVEARSAAGSLRLSEGDVASLPGIGPYALDSYRIFCLGDRSRFESGDKELAAYLERSSA